MIAWLRAEAVGPEAMANAHFYPFPTDLDLDPLVSRQAPPSQADIVWQP